MKKNHSLKKAKALVAFFGLLFVSWTGSGQTSKLIGKVVDENNQPLIGATVLVKEQSQGTSTNYDGEFTMELENGNHNLIISYVGFRSLTKSIAVKSNKEILFTLVSNENILEEVLVSAVRVKENAPVTHSNLGKKELAKRNLGQDIPILMNYLPSVVSSSDAGAGVGYTYIRVRGSDASRVNVTINGIPYNDAESQGTFWVNMGDFASSVENLQLQRGVGTSTNGSGAFGASLNILTDAVF